MDSQNKILILSLAALVSLVTSACSSADPMTGTWHQSDATTPLPMVVGGGDLDVDATLVLDGAAAEATFELTLQLSFRTLADTVVVLGTYVDNGSDLTLTVTGLQIEPDSGNTVTVSEDGAQCVLMQGFGGAGVCFPTHQTNDYTLDNDTLGITIEQAIAGAATTETTLNLTRLEEGGA